MLQNNYKQPINHSFKENYNQLSLKQQIHHYQNKINIYQSLQREINTLSHTINQSKSKDQIPTAHTITQPSQTKINSNKKVKIYELNRKFNKINAQLKQKLNNSDNLKYQLQNIIAKTIQAQKLIRFQQQLSKQLQKNYQEIENKLKTVNRIQEQQIIQLQNRVNRLKTYQFQKQRIIDQLQRINQSNNIITLSMNEEYNDKYQNKQSLIHSGNLQFSPSKQFTDEFHSPCHIKRKTIQFEFQQEFIECINKSQKKEINLLYENSKLSNINSPTKKQLYEEIILKQLKQKYINQHQKHKKLINQIFQIEQFINNLYCHSKHKVLTQKLNSSQIQFYQHKIQLLKQQQNFFNCQCQQIAKKISHIEGQRGSIRGNLGVKVQQTIIVNMINRQISRNMNAIQDRLQFLKKYWIDIKKQYQ